MVAGARGTGKNNSVTKARETRYASALIPTGQLHKLSCQANGSNKRGSSVGAHCVVLPVYNVCNIVGTYGMFGLRLRSTFFCKLYSALFGILGPVWYY